MHRTGRDEAAAESRDALESVVNVAAAIAALVAVHYSAQPADANHPYGHDKAEYFSAVLEGALILVAVMRHFDVDDCLVSESDILDGVAWSVHGP